MTTLQQWITGDEAPESLVNENFIALEHIGVYAMNPATTTALTWGYLGGRWGGFAITTGTLTLANGATNYIVVLRSTGVISVSSTATNWNNTALYARVYKVVTAGGVVTGTPEDHRAGAYGVHGLYQTLGGGWPAFQYKSETGSVADSDPTAGLFKWNNATHASATQLYFDDLTTDTGVDLSTFFGTLNAKGYIFIINADDSAQYQVWRWTSIPTDGTSYWKFTVTLMVSTGTFADDLTCRIAFLSMGSTIGRHAIPIMASSITPSVTGGCAALATIASAANQPDITTLNFDPTTEEYAQFSFPMPKKWDEGTITFKALWSHAATTVNFGVAWKLQAVAVSDDDAIAVAFGTAIAVTDTGGTTNDEYTTAESAAITIAGSPAAEDLVFFRVFREPSNGSDNMAIDARLHGLILYVNTDSETDA